MSKPAWYWNYHTKMSYIHGGFQSGRVPPKHQRIVAPKAKTVDKLCHRDRENGDLRQLMSVCVRVCVWECVCESVFESVPSRPESAGNFLEMQSLTALPRGRPNKPQMCSRICPPAPPRSPPPPKTTETHGSEEERDNRTGKGRGRWRGKGRFSAVSLFQTPSL